MTMTFSKTKLIWVGSHVGWLSLSQNWNNWNNYRSHQSLLVFVGLSVPLFHKNFGKVVMKKLISFIVGNTLILCISANLHTDCFNLNLIANKAAFYHKHRCYVITDSPAMSWPSAALSCNDAPLGGLALWIDAHVFDWVKSTAYSTKWIWTGMVNGDANTAGIIGVYGPNQPLNLRFTQQGLSDESLSYKIPNETTGVIIHNIHDTWNTNQPFGSIHTVDNYGWGDEEASLQYSHAICQYGKLTFMQIYLNSQKTANDCSPKNVLIVLSMTS